MRNPQQDGLSSSAEFEELKQIEDRIEHGLAAIGALYVGRITTQARREFYFCVPSSGDVERWAGEVMSAFTGYTYESGSQPDPESQHYLNVLYPTPAAMQQIANRHVLTELKKEGDVHETPRAVDHFAYFADPSARDAFGAWARSRGFEVRTLGPDEGDLPWGTELTKVHSVDPRSIDTVTLELLVRCERHGGKYDGWGCPVVRPAKPTSFVDRLFRRRP